MSKERQRQTQHQKKAEKKKKRQGDPNRKTRGHYLHKRRVELIDKGRSITSVDIPPIVPLITAIQGRSSLKTLRKETRE
jgi:hypothetical protein